MANQKNRRGWIVAGTGCGCALILVLVIGGIYLYAGWLGYQEEPMYVERMAVGAQLSDPYSLTADQEDRLFSNGYPQAFTILFYEEEVPGGGIQTVRLEIWDYYAQAVSLTFLNGELVSEEILEIDQPIPLEPLPVYPEQFSAFMSLEDVLSAAGITTYIQIPLENAFIEDGVMYFSQGLSFGLKDDELIYLEALAVSK